MKITSQDQIYFFRDNEIIRFESVPGFTIVHSLNGTTTEIFESIDEIEVQLAETDFIRTDQRQIVNLNHITSISKGPEGFIVLDNGLKLPITTSRKDAIISLLNNHLKHK